MTFLYGNGVKLIALSPRAAREFLSFAHLSLNFGHPLGRYGRDEQK